MGGEVQVATCLRDGCQMKQEIMKSEAYFRLSFKILKNLRQQPYTKIQPIDTFARLDRSRPVPTGYANPVHPGVWALDKNPENPNPNQPSTYTLVHSTLALK